MKKRRLIVVSAALLVVTVIAFLSPIGGVALWLFDRALSFEQRKAVFQDENVVISFVQKVDVDFYYTFFHVKRPSGAESEVLINCDDPRWWGIEVRQEGARYVVSGRSPWSDLPESHFDTSTQELYAGGYRRYHSLDGKFLRDE